MSKQQLSQQEKKGCRIKKGKVLLKEEPKLMHRRELIIKDIREECYEVLKQDPEWLLEQRKKVSAFEYIFT